MVKMSRCESSSRGLVPTRQTCTAQGPQSVRNHQTWFATENLPLLLLFFIIIIIIIIIVSVLLWLQENETGLTLGCYMLVDSYCLCGGLSKFPKYTHWLEGMPVLLCHCNQQSRRWMEMWNSAVCFATTLRWNAPICSPGFYLFGSVQTPRLSTLDGEWRSRSSQIALISLEQSADTNTRSASKNKSRNTSTCK